jgi:hypothetical protein
MHNTVLRSNLHGVLLLNHALYAVMITFHCYWTNPQQTLLLIGCQNHLPLACTPPTVCWHAVTLKPNASI